MSPSLPEGENGFVIHAALMSDLGIAVAKFFAAAWTGSAAMLTEGLHSVVDSLNQILLLHGQRRSRRPADAVHPLGYGRELYFWSFIVAILIFATGAGLSLYEGVHHVLTPAVPENEAAAYAVLAISAILEGASWLTARRAFAHAKGRQGWWAAIRRSKDPPAFIVLLEDSAALVGLLIAGAGILLSQRTGDGRWDGVASMLIGCVLGGVAMVLARESKGLLIGERAAPELIQAVRSAIAARPEVVRVGPVLTLHIGPRSVFVGADVDFDDSVPAGAVERAIAEVERTLRRHWPQIATLYIKPRTLAGGASGMAP